MHGAQAAAGERRVLRHAEGGTVLGLPRLQALPTARCGRQSSAVGGEAARASRGRTRRADPCRRPACRGRGSRAREALVPEALRHDVPGVLPRAAPRRRVPADQGGFHRERSGQRIGVRIGERFSRRVRACLRGSAGRGGRRRGRRTRVDRLARGSARGRGDGRRPVLPRVQRPPHARGATCDLATPAGRAAGAGPASLARRAARTARRLLRRPTPALRPAARDPRHAVPGAGVANAARDPLRRDVVLPRRRDAHRPARGDARGRYRERHEPHRHRHSLPPRRERRRPHGRLRRRCVAQAVPARPRARAAGDSEWKRWRRRGAQPPPRAMRCGRDGHTPFAIAVDPSNTSQLCRP